MSRTVDLVIVAGDASAIAAAAEAARRGLQVLVVVGCTDGSLSRGLHRTLRAAGTRVRRQVTVLTNAEVVCVDGVARVEAVLIRRMRTGSLIGVNAGAIEVIGGEAVAAPACEDESADEQFRRTCRRWCEAPWS